MFASAVAAGVQLQLAELRNAPAQLLVLLTTPLFSAMFLSVALYSGNNEILTNAVLAPGLMSLWMLAIGQAGRVISGDRWAGRLELLLVAPAPLLLSVIGRIAAQTCIGVVALVESVVMARVVFGIDITVRHPLLLAAALLVTLAALVGTATMLAGLFVLGREVLLFQNTLIYPFYILGGVLVPLEYLPDWVQPISRVIFMYWSGELIRDCFDQVGAVADWPWRLLAVAGLGAAALLVGLMLINAISARVRRIGSAGRA